jgi:hypothetical protein
MKLAAIAGVNGVFTDKDIAKVVALARKARKTWKGGDGAKAGKRAPRKAAAKAPATARKAVKKAAAAPRKAASKSARQGA